MGCINGSLSAIVCNSHMYLILRHRMELLVSIACMGLLGYLCLQGFYGVRSYHYRDTLTNKLANLTADFNGIANQRKVLENKVKMVQPGTMDTDLVDEMARHDLNMGKATDVVVLLKP